ncbi:MAG: hypothetical protein JNK35_05975 [Phycisphaerae bacterium]|nr:hypothetical protein [Phycisphaerae bacterium]
MPTRHRTPAALSAAALLTLAACLPACSRSDDHAVRHAAETLNKITFGGSQSVPSVDSRKQTFSTVISELAAAKGLSEQAAAAAAGLTARAQAGLAEIGATELVDGERKVLGSLTAVRAALGIWASQNARAAIAESYKPDADLAAIDRQAADVEAATGAAADAQRAADARVASLEKDADALIAQSRAKRTDAAALRQQMANSSETEALSLLERAAAIARAADALDVRAADLKAQAALARPAVDDARRAIDLLASRRESLKASRAAVQARAQAGQAAAVEARRLAASAAADATRAFAEASALRSGPIASGLDTATKNYRAAIASAKKAQQGGKNEARTEAALAAAGFSQALGDALFVHARGLDSFATIAEAAVSASPALPDASSFAAAAKSARDALASTIEEARAAYEDARAGFDAAGGKPEVKDAVAKLIDVLNRVSAGKAKLAADPADPAQADPGASADPATPGDPPADPANPAANSPADPAAETAAIKKAFTDFTTAIREGRADDALAFILTDTDEAASAVEAVLTPMLNLVALDAACKSKLNAGLAEIMQATPIGPMFGPLMMGGESLSTFKPDQEEVRFLSATSAEVVNTTEQKGPPSKVVKKGDRWLLTVPSDLAAQAKSPAAAMMVGLGQAAADLTDDVKAGKATKEQVASALMAKLMPPGMPKLPRNPSSPPGGG